MALTLVSAPGDLATMLLPSVLDHLRRYADLSASPAIAPPDLAYIEEVTRSAVATVDGPKGRLGRCLVNQTWRLTVDCWHPEIALPLPPVQSVTQVRYRDRGGAWQIMEPSQYRLFGAGSWAAELSPAYGMVWPAITFDRDSVEIEFVTGYGDDINDIPASLLHGIRLLAAHFYVERQPVTFATPHEMPFGVKEILAPYKVYR